MKFKVTFKTPDAVHFALADLEGPELEEASDLADEYIESGEYVTIEFDTEKQTATVMKA